MVTENHVLEIGIKVLSNVPLTDATHPKTIGACPKWITVPSLTLIDSVTSSISLV